MRSPGLNTGLGGEADTTSLTQLGIACVLTSKRQSGERVIVPYLVGDDLRSENPVDLPNPRAEFSNCTADQGVLRGRKIVASMQRFPSRVRVCPSRVGVGNPVPSRPGIGARHVAAGRQNV
jgi:hypothetical protein